MATLEAYGTKPKLAQHLGGRLMQALRRWTNRRLQPGTFLAKLLDEAKIADKKGSLVAEDKIAALAAEAGQVSDIDRVGNEESVDLFLGQSRGQLLSAKRGIIHA